MAVQAHHLNPLFSYPDEATGLLYDTTTFNPAVECHQTPLLSPVYNFAPVDYLFQHSTKPTIQSVDSSVTFNSENNGNNVPVSSSYSRKRSREEYVNRMPSEKHDPLMFFGEDLSSNLQHQHFHIDRLISNHMERIRMEIEEKRRTQGRKVMEAIEHGLMKTLRAKDAEINHIGKLNLFLEEKVKSLSVDNQIWREMAQSNEATVNTLRSNLQQVLAVVEQRKQWEEPTVAEDEQSCCGSSDEGEAQDKKRMRRITMCRGCGKGEASVLLLPCRHMCLCTVCGSSLNTCPICDSPKNASLNVNISS